MENQEISQSPKEEGQIIQENSSKKRKISEFQEDLISKYLLPIHVNDYNPLTKQSYKEIFENTEDFLLWISINSKHRIRHNQNNTYVESKCKNLVTKRYLYFRIDQKTQELEDQVRKYKEDVSYYKNKYYSEADYTKKLEADIKSLKNELSQVKKDNQDYANNQKLLLDFNQSLLTKSMLSNNLMTYSQPQQMYQNSLYEQLFNFNNMK